MEVAMKHISKKRTGLIVGILLLLIFPFSWNTSYRPAIMPTDLAANESTEGAMKLFQQENGKIVGEVQNSKGGEAVPAANIMIDGTNLGAASDKNGKFEINNVPPGKYTLKASMLGFIMLELRDIKVESGKASSIRIHLKPDITDVQKVGVEITPPPPPPKEKLVNIKEKQQGKEKLVTIEEKQQGEVPPPPPPPPPVKDKETLVDYDTPPEVVGGFGEVAKAIKYPEIARKAGVTGTVYISVKIDEQGKVLETKILESLNAECDQAAVDALRSVNWKPAIKDKKPVKVWVTVPVRFKLK
jgi:protein TonB